MRFMEKKFLQVVVILSLVFLSLMVYGRPAEAELFMSISGTVKDASTGKGIGGIKVFGVSFQAKKGLYAVTDNNGNYITKMVPEGEYSILVIPPTAYINQSYQKIIKVERGKNILGANFELPLGGTVSGVIYQNDGVTPLANTYVSVLTDKGFASSFTDSSGNYIMSGLSPETSAFLRFIIHGYGVITKDNINILSGQITSNVNIMLPPATTGIRGTVSTFDSVGMPIKDTFVVLRNDKNFGMTLTNSNGNYEIKGIEEGIYEAIIFRVGYEVKYLTDVFISQNKLVNLNIALNEKPIPKPGESITMRGNFFSSPSSLNKDKEQFDINLQLVTSGSKTFCFPATLALSLPMMKRNEKGEKEWYAVSASVSYGLCQTFYNCGGNQECLVQKAVYIFCYGTGANIGLSATGQKCSGPPKSGWYSETGGSISAFYVTGTASTNCIGGGVSVGLPANLYVYSCYVYVVDWPEGIMEITP